MDAKTPETMRTKRRREKKEVSAIGGQDQLKLSVLPSTLDRDTEFKMSCPRERRSGAWDAGGGENSGGNEHERGDGKQPGGDLGDGEEEGDFVDVENDVTGEEQERSGGRLYSENAVEIFSEDDAPMEEKTKRVIDTIVICSDSEDDDGMKEKATLQKTDNIPVPWSTVSSNEVDGVCKKCDPGSDDSDSSVCDSPLPAPKRSRVSMPGSSDRSLLKGTPLKTKDGSEDVRGSSSSTSAAAPPKRPKNGAAAAEPAVINRSNLKARFDKRAATSTAAAAEVALLTSARISTYGDSEDVRVSAFATPAASAVVAPSAAVPLQRPKQGAAAAEPAGIDRSNLKAQFDKRAATSTAAAAQDTLLSSAVGEETESEDEEEGGVFTTSTANVLSLATSSAARLQQQLGSRSGEGERGGGGGSVGGANPPRGAT